MGKYKINSCITSHKSVHKLNLRRSSIDPDVYQNVIGVCLPLNRISFCLHNHPSECIVRLSDMFCVLKPK